MLSPWRVGAIIGEYTCASLDKGPPRLPLKEVRMCVIGALYANGLSWLFREKPLQNIKRLFVITHKANETGLTSESGLPTNRNSRKK